MDATVSRLFARVGLMLAAFALLSQAWAFSALPMSAPHDPRGALHELAAVVGDGVALCVQVNPVGPPSPPPCDDKCPLCQAAHGGFAFVLPTLAALAAPLGGSVGRLPARAGTQPPSPFIAAAQARGPPFEA